MKRTILTGAFMLALLIGTACGSSKSASENMELITGRQWQLAYMNGEPVQTSQFPNGVPDANFTDGLKITGKGGCNGYSGTYNINDESGINISQVVSTKMYCEAAAGEAAYFKALEAADEIIVESDKLILFRDTKETLVFKPKE